VSAVGIRLSDRVYGLDAAQAQFLAAQLQRRLTVPEPVARLADELWRQSMRNPDAGEASRDITLDEQQKRELLDTLTRVQPEGDAIAWNELAAALRRDLDAY
jgi:hypothetical protein